MQEEPVSVPTFVVGTGRCGSTMLSNMLREHPHVLSLSEFFSQVSDSAPDLFPLEPIDGSRFWAMVAGNGPFNTFFLQHDILCAENLYRCDAPGARFSAQTGVPAILVVALPHLTEHHEALFDVVQDEVETWPNASVGEHYRRLFGLLQAHFGKRLWIERSGSITFIRAEQLLATFPDARFIHIVRDGRDAALSIREHPPFRLFVVMSALGEALGVNPIKSQDRAHIDRVPSELRPFLPERFDAEAFRAFRPPLPICGTFWAQQIESGLKVLSTLGSDRLLTLRYEDILAEPKKQLDVVSAFLGGDFSDEDWSARGAAMVRKPRSTWRDLPEEDARALTEACRPGFDLLREVGVHYEN
jgi:putative sulfotransferase